MKRELFIHFAIWFFFFVLISIIKNYISFSYWPFWLGGIFGTLMPDIDHLIYVLFLNPQELTSKRVEFLIKNKQLMRVMSLLYETRSERKNLVFHTYMFEIIFFIVTIFILSSSGSILVHGIVLAFFLHLLVDELTDILEVKNLSNWGQIFSKELDYNKSLMLIFASFFVILLIGIFM